MANVIEIVIKATNQAAGPLRDVERQAAGVKGSFSGISSTAVGVATAIAGIGLAAFKATADLAGMVEQLDRVSGKTGVGIGDIQVYRQILEDAGASPESLTQGLMFLSRAIATNDPILKKLGITTRDTGEAFRQLMDILGRSTDETARNQVAFAILGRGSADLAGNAALLSRGFDEMKGKMEAAGALITDKTAPALRGLDSELDTLRLNWKGFWQNAVEVAVPAANEIVVQLNRILEASRRSGNPFSGVMGMTANAWLKGAGGTSGMVGGIEVKAPKLESTNQLLADSLKKAARSTDDLAGLLYAAMLTPPAMPGLRRPDAFMGFLGGPAPEAGPPVASERTHQILGDWRSLVAEITSSASILDETLNSLFNGLTSGFQQVFAGLLEGAQTFGSAMKTLFRSLVDEILAQLARLVAAKVFGFLLNLLGVAVVGSGGGGGGGPSYQTRSGGWTTPGRSSASQASTEVHIHAIDERSFAEHFRSMGGSVRVTERRLAESAEW